MINPTLFKGLRKFLVDLQFFFGMATSAKGDEVVRRVAVRIPVRDFVMHLDSVITPTKPALVFITVKYLCANDSPFPIIRGGFAASPENGVFTALNHRLSGVRTCATASHFFLTILNAKFFAANNAFNYLSVVTPSAFEVARIGAVFSFFLPAQWGIETLATTSAFLFAAILFAVCLQSLFAGIPCGACNGITADFAAIDFAFVPRVFSAATRTMSNNLPHTLFVSRENENSVIARARIAWAQQVMPQGVEA